jgi:hypothetical protein
MPPAHRAALGQDAENRLYELGCELVEAAAGIARGAADPAAARAVPALLGCIEAALQELSAAALALRPDQRGNTLDRGYRNLDVALQDARLACHAARALTARQRE